MPNRSAHIKSLGGSGSTIPILLFIYWSVNVALVIFADGALIWNQWANHPAVGEFLMVLPFYIMASISLPIECAIRGKVRPLSRFIWSFPFTSLRIFVAYPPIGLLLNYLFGNGTK